MEPSSGEQMTGAELMCQVLVESGTEVVFGYPGGAIMPFYDALGDAPLRHILVRHEENAAFAADGYARASGRPAVCVATSGPGATNLVTGLATAWMDSTPVVAITGQVSSPLLGTRAFQESDVVAITASITKQNWLVSNVQDLERCLTDAFRLAVSGRPGPVLVDVCKDVQLAAVSRAARGQADEKSPCSLEARGEPALSAVEGQIAAAVGLLAGAERPVILAGHGVILAGAGKELLELAETIDAPIATTLLGLSAVPASHPLHLGMMGMHGSPWTNLAIHEADVLFAVGMRFDDRVTGEVSQYARNSQVIHVDVDPAEPGRLVHCDAPVFADAKTALSKFVGQMPVLRHPTWHRQVQRWRDAEQCCFSVDREAMTVPHVLETLSTATCGRALVVTDVGQHQMWEAQYYRHEVWNSLITSGGLGSMGFALPAAIGAKLARPDQEVWAVMGDGGFQMSIPELATVVQEQLPLKIAIMNNGFLGMVRQWQEFFHGRRYASTRISSPNLPVLASAYGIAAQTVTDCADIERAIAIARAHDGPYLLEFKVSDEDNVYPMVAPGKSISEMIRRPTAAGA